ncbi:iron-sulfur cluster assembly protein [Pararhizobium sp. BT-229]|uniref:iron-sulfur cluster assembly protein n=1 Tax=Pararhizobium sp. BT-229 TaxID=2986923 RepID=UPI0021F73696|nr:iron-sulfur cluster assembly protein [Pararhizobium sp. BT-229]MCV9963195.1 iron-sulfur cluster assembly protein [Pararhizobium sp. BT-229]
MNAATLSESRQRELWRRLEDVNDPELDEPVTDMGFIERAEIAIDGTIDLGFRLPTYWCSPNFAFLMLDDVRKALEGLPWCPDYRITLHDHMFAEDVNKGIAEGKSFAEIFGSLAEKTDLDDLREKFRLKAFKRRQEAVILDLRGIGLPDGEIVAMSLAAFDTLEVGSEEAWKHKARYRQALLLRWQGLHSRDLAFVDYEGESIAPEALQVHLADLRSVRINMEFNGALCRGLKGTRYKEMEMVDGEPTLVDFIMGRVPAPETRQHSSST